MCGGGRGRESPHPSHEEESNPPLSGKPVRCLCWGGGGEFERSRKGLLGQREPLCASGVTQLLGRGGCSWHSWGSLSPTGGLTARLFCPEAVCPRSRRVPNLQEQVSGCSIGMPLAPALGGTQPGSRPLGTESEAPGQAAAKCLDVHKPGHLPGAVAFRPVPNLCPGSCTPRQTVPDCLKREPDLSRVS